MLFAGADRAELLGAAEDLVPEALRLGKCAQHLRSGGTRRVDLDPPIPDHPAETALVSGDALAPAMGLLEGGC